ncbi:MAG: carboxypeptidase-like regulatory domain-containing protein [Acidobacteriota bacterium]
MFKPYLNSAILLALAISNAAPAEGRTGSISGTLRDAVTGQPVPGGYVSVFDDEGQLEGNVQADDEGRYAYSVLEPGSYFVHAEASTHTPVLYDGLTCDPLECDVTIGTPVVVGDGETTGIDFAMQPYGRITGTVRNGATGEPVSAGKVTVWRLDDDFGGLVQLVEIVDGGFATEPLSPGSYALFTAKVPGLYGLAYPDVVCQHLRVYELRSHSACDFASAQAIEVPLNTTVDGVDFALRPGGYLSGRVVADSTGLPRTSVGVFVYDARGRTAAEFWEVDGDGRFRVGPLAPGGYFLLVTDFAGDLLNHVVGAGPCPYNSSCDPTAGELIQIVEGEEVEGLEVRLQVAGTVRGRVVDAFSSEPLDNTEIFFTDRFGTKVWEVRTNSEGEFDESLAPGSYLVAADTSAHRPEVWPGRPASFLDYGYLDSASLAMAEEVVIEAGRDIGGLDFALEPLASVDLAVKDETGGEPLFCMRHFWRSKTDLVQSARGFPCDGTFPATSSLPPGTYYVTVEATYSDPFAPGYARELYPGVPCYFTTETPHVGCELEQGQPVTVGFGSKITDLEMDLGRGGRLSGTITDSADIRIPGSRVEVYDASGRYLASIRSGYFYEIDGLPPGTYRLVARGGDDHLDQVWPGISCSGDGCDPLAGEPVTVAAGEDAFSFDFELAPDPGPCAEDTARCLVGDRFLVTASWRDGSGNAGEARAARITDDSAYFWFFDPDNVELVVKVLDACVEPFQRYWVFAAGLTDVEVEIEVVDLLSDTRKTYRNPQGTSFEPLLDTEGFDTCRAPSDPPSSTPSKRVTETVAAPAMVQGTPRAGDPSFSLQAHWWTADDNRGRAQVERITDDTYYLWFFERDNVEVVVKVLDACQAPFHRYWVFATGLTDVGVELRVEESGTDQVRRYEKPPGQPFEPIFDTDAFLGCITP